MTTDTEKWKARAEDLYRFIQRIYTAEGIAALEAALAAAYAAGREEAAQVVESKICCNPDPHTFALKQVAAAIRAREQKP